MVLYALIPWMEKEELEIPIPESLSAIINGVIASGVVGCLYVNDNHCRRSGVFSTLIGRLGQLTTRGYVRKLPITRALLPESTTRPLE